MEENSKNTETQFNHLMEIADLIRHVFKSDPDLNSEMNPLISDSPLQTANNAYFFLLEHQPFTGRDKMLLYLEDYLENMRDELGSREVLVDIAKDIKEMLGEF